MAVTPPPAPPRPTEDILAKVFDLTDRLPTAKLPSRSQWEALREEMAATQNPQDQATVIQKLRQHAETTGGAHWKGVIEPLKQALDGLTPGDVKFFVDALVRKLRPTLTRERD